MRNLTKSVEIHRTDKGRGKSCKGDQYGRFEIPLGHNRYSKNRVAVCYVHRGLGWDRLSISVQTVNGNNRGRRVIPTHHEACRVRNLFFESWENPIQFHPKQSFAQGKDAAFMELWLPPHNSITPLQPPSPCLDFTLQYLPTP